MTRTRVGFTRTFPPVHVSRRPLAEHTSQEALSNAILVVDELLASSADEHIARRLQDIRRHCQLVLQALKLSLPPQPSDREGERTMTKLLATIYSPRWQVVIDTELQTGSQIRIRDLRPSAEDPEIIAALKDDLDNGETITSLAGDIVPTAKKPTRQAIQAVLTILATVGGPDVFVVPEQGLPSP